MKRKCENCGADLSSKVKFCPSCGEVIPEKEKIKLSKKKMGFIAGIAGVVIAVGIFCATRPSTIDLNDYLEYEVSGCEGYGELWVDLNDEKLAQDIYTIVQKKEMISKDVLFEDVRISADANKTENLSNGDSVEISFEYSKDEFKNYGIKLKGNSKTIKVEGLEKIKEVDIFEDLKLEFEGRMPQVYTMEYISVKSFTCHVTPYENLSVGDEITIVCETEGPVDGVIPKKTETKIKVPDTVEHYVTDSEDLSEDNKKELREVIEKVVNKKYPYDMELDNTAIVLEEGEYWDETCPLNECELSNIKIADEMQFCVVSTERWEDNCNGVVARYEFDGVVDSEDNEHSGEKYHGYGYCVIKNIVKGTDGKLKLEDDAVIEAGEYVEKTEKRCSKDIKTYCKETWGDYEESTVSIKKEK